MPTVEEVLNLIRGEGLRVLNLFEREDGTWQANLCDGEGVWEFGLAEDPAGALATALENTKNGPKASFTKGRAASDDELEKLFK